MDCYKVDSRKKSRALGSYIRNNIGKCGKFIKLCYVLTKFLRVLAVILGLFNIAYFMESGDALDLILLIVYFGFPMALSFLPWAVYHCSVGVEYRSRIREIIVFNDKGFEYSYEGLTGGVQLVYKVRYSDISNIRIDPSTRVVEVRGRIVLDEYRDSLLVDTVDAEVFDFIDVYDISVVDMISTNINVG